MANLNTAQAVRDGHVPCLLIFKDKANPPVTPLSLGWQIRQAMGIHDHADSYLVLLVRTISGWNPPTQLVNTVAACALTISIALSVALNVKDWRAGERRFAVHPKDN